MNAGAIGRHVPAVRWLPSYERAWFRADAVAGVTAAAVVLPQAMAYATIAGLPVQIGLYSAIVPMLMYALFGSSRKLSVSTTSTVAALTGAVLVTSDLGGSADAAVDTLATLVFLVGVTLLVARLFRLGAIVENVSQPVLIGFRAGLGLSIAAGQLGKLLGVDVVGDGFFDKVWSAITQLDTANAATVTLAVGSILGLLLIKRFAPSVPGPLIVLAAGIVLVEFADLAAHGVALIPEVPSGLPAPALPGFHNLDVLVPAAVAIALMSFLESSSAGRAARTPDDPRLDNNQELVALSSSNIVGSLFGAMPASGGFSQTAVNASAGARTQVSELVTVCVSVLTALFLAPVLSKLPEATLGAVVFVAAVGLVTPRAFVRLARSHPVELLTAIVTGLAALTIGLLVAVVVGVVLTYVMVLVEFGHPNIVELHSADGRTNWQVAKPGDARRTGLLVLRVEASLYMANIRSTLDRIRTLVDDGPERPSTVVLDLSATTDLSTTVIDELESFAGDLAKQDTDLWIARLSAHSLARLHRMPEWELWSASGRLHPGLDSAADAFGARHTSAAEIPSAE